MFKYVLTLLLVCFLLTACSKNIESIGELGPKKLKVYQITHNDFLTANRMLVVLNKNGDIAAFTGGTVAGAGSVGLQASGTIISAGAIIYGSKAIEHGLENVKVKGIPSDVTVKADVKGSLEDMQKSKK